MQTHNKQTLDVYEVVTNNIIERLEKGVIPWRQPWTNAGMPKNLVTGKSYRGINVMLLASVGYEHNQFLTFSQAKELGASVRKGEKSHLVIFWKQIEKTDKETGKTKRIPFLKHYRVFNISQCDGIPKEKLPLKEERINDPILECESIIAGMPHKPRIQHKEHMAYYDIRGDYVNMPEVRTFENSESYYGTLFHELTHSTGHESRLNRKEVMSGGGFGSESYALEELTAEIGASYLKSYAGIPIEELDNSAAYIQGWLKRLQNDKKLIFHASAQAQKATDFILDVRVVEKDQAEERELEEVERKGEMDMIRMRGREEELRK